MNAKIGTYVARRGEEKPERRLLLDIKAVHTWLAVIGILGGWFGAAAVGVYSTANLVVPPIARKALAKEIQRIDKNEARIEANADKVDANRRVLEQDMKFANQQTIDTLRGDMAQLTRALDSYEKANVETTRVVHELLLRLPKDRASQTTGH